MNPARIVSRLVFAAATAVLVSSVAVSAQMPPAQVRTEPVRSGTVALTQPLVATIEPVRQTQIATEQAGLVIERFFDDGEPVEANAPLVRMDSGLLKTELDAAVAARQSAEAELQRARLDVTNTRRERERQESLFARQAASERELLDAQTAADRAAASVIVNEAIVNERRADEATLALRIEKATVRTPVGGIVARRRVEVGQWLTQGAAVADLVTLDPLYVRVNVPEGVVSRLTRGDTAEVIVPALANARFEAIVEQILPTADAASRTFPVRLLLNNPDGRVLPGFFARTTLSSRGGEAFVVPRDALVQRGTDAHVVAVRNNAAVIVPVRIVHAGEDGFSVQPIDGDLTEGEPVVTRGNETLRPGQPLILPQGPPR